MRCPAFEIAQTPWDDVSGMRHSPYQPGQAVSPDKSRWGVVGKYNHEIEVAVRAMPSSPLAAEPISAMASSLVAASMVSI